jgi:hypothetical protein
MAFFRNHITKLWKFITKSYLFNHLIKNKIKHPQKLFFKKIPKYVPNMCSQPKSSRKGNNVTFLKLFLNVMTMNIKIQNIFDIIKVSEFIQCKKW